MHFSQPVGGVAKGHGTGAPTGNAEPSPKPRYVRMSAIVPFMEDMQYRVRKRIIGNIAGVICFVALYYLLPPSIYAYIGIIGGIGVGFSVKYGWQAVFNTFGALAIAAQTYGLKGAVSLRVIQNVFGVAFALVFCILFYWMMSKSCKLASNQV